MTVIVTSGARRTSDRALLRVLEPSLDERESRQSRRFDGQVPT
jgi:hypothetical protein